MNCYLPRSFLPSAGTFSRGDGALLASVKAMVNIKTVPNTDILVWRLSRFDKLFICGKSRNEAPGGTASPFRLFSALLVVLHRPLLDSFRQHGQGCFLSPQLCPDLLKLLSGPLKDARNKFALLILYSPQDSFGLMASTWTGLGLGGAQHDWPFIVKTSRIKASLILFLVIGFFELGEFIFVISG